MVFQMLAVGDVQVAVACAVEQTLHTRHPARNEKTINELSFVADKEVSSSILRSLC